MPKSLKYNWAAGDKVLASDINDNFEKIATLFGGDGSDGSLDTSGGTVDIDLGNAAYVVKNYTDINVVTNNLTFSNPHANGTIVVLKSQGDVTISATIDASGIGAAAGNEGIGVITVPPAGGDAAGTGPGSAGAGSTGVKFLQNLAGKMIKVTPGAGGGDGSEGANSGGGEAGSGGRGGGGLIIECAGALDFSGTITVAGDAGSNASAATSGGSGGGGGGAGGSAVIIYNTLTANTGTLVKDGGDGGDGGDEGGSSSGQAGGGGGGGGSNVDDGGAGGDGGNATGAGSNGSAGGGTDGGAAGSAGSTAGTNGSGGGGGGGSEGVAYVIENTEF